MHEHDRDASERVDQDVVIRTWVAENMRRIRLARGMSLRDVAAKANLSKALMSQIERGVANPTIATLTQVSSALDISFSELTRSSQIEPQIVPAVDGSDGPSGGRLLFSMPERRRFDVSEGHLHPGEQGVPSDHGTGSVEYGYVVDGEVELVLAGRDVLHLKAGDAVQFSAASPHLYRALGSASRIVTVVAYSDD